MHSVGSAPLRLALAGMVALAAAMGIGRFIYTPILPGMMQALSLSPADAGLIASANYLGYLLGAIAAAGGWAAGNERRIALAGLAANALIAAAMAASASLLAFILLRFLGGLASAFVMIFTTSIVFSHLASNRRTDLQAVHFAGVGLGIAVSSAMMAGLIGIGADWQAGWIGAALLSAAGLAAVMLLLDRGSAAHRGAGHREPPLPKRRPLVFVIVAYGLFGFGYIITATFLIAIVRAGGDGRLFETAVWFATGLAALPSVFVWDMVARRTGLIPAFAVGCLAEAAGVASSVAFAGAPGPLIGGMLLGGTFVGLTALGLRAANQMAPASPRRVLAIMTAAFGIGQILGPIAAGFIAEWTGDFVLASATASLVLVAAAVISLASLMKRI